MKGDLEEGRWRDNGLERSESEEYIVGPGGKVRRMEVWETREVEVDRDGDKVQFAKDGQVDEGYEGEGKGFKTSTTVTALNSLPGGGRRKSESRD